MNIAYPIAAELNMTAPRGRDRMGCAGGRDGKEAARGSDITPSRGTG